MEIKHVHIYHPACQKNCFAICTAPRPMFFGAMDFLVWRLLWASCVSPATLKLKLLVAGKMFFTILNFLEGWWYQSNIMPAK